MGYVSRRYLREKYEALKFDMESVLDVYNKEIPDKIDGAEVKRVYANIKDKMEAIESELMRGLE